jgi:hypothetical protein
MKKPFSAPRITTQKNQPKLPLTNASTLVTYRENQDSTLFQRSIFVFLNRLRCAFSEEA